ncbi:hypothetical protein PPL_05371 [Heterostelium album PN500]|uniref:RNase III domain-containing protein n=1 Tax=Heterostelium pallidum (strain ATCC 26659 / Pp 5 / PN500) TaxID=670386 RepID=D3B9Z9_HETP5|nr:hypothetical protein PPL_05371 [Heterostelium album PN500]EFA81386.1 hypothetical protein PPL_05371 [Heterostelium album PN500]|eukprot:XP_020433504.1 hypothetical protein PPL_05371 [Heterostelium album PN500]
MYSRFLIQQQSKSLKLCCSININSVYSYSSTNNFGSSTPHRTRAKRYINNNDQLSTITTTSTKSSTSPKQINTNIDRDIFNYATSSPLNSHHTQHHLTRLNPIISSLSNDDHIIVSANQQHQEGDFKIDKQSLAKQLSKFNIQFKDNIIPQAIIESLSQNTKQYSYSHLNRYFFLGNVIYNTNILEQLKNSGIEHETKAEYKSIIKGSYFLSKRCEIIGLSEFISGSMPSDQSKFKSFYLKHFHYRSLMQFVGALYQEQGLNVANEFIDKFILQSSAIQPEQYILEFPESIVLKKFYQYKIEPPHIIVSQPGGRCPIYRGSIVSGNKRLVETYGFDENEAKCHAFELLNTQCNSITSVLKLLMNDKPITDIDEDDNNVDSQQQQQ